MNRSTEKNDKDESEQSNRTTEDLLREINNRIPDSSPKNLMGEIFQGLGCFIKGVFFLAVGIVFYYVIPAIILWLGISADKLFKLENLFIGISFFILFLYMLWLGYQAHKRG